MPSMVAARQELDLRPELERLDRLICWSEDIDEGALMAADRRRAEAMLHEAAAHS